MKYMGTTAAAKQLGITDGRIRQLILGRLLRAEKLGRDWCILPSDLNAIKNRNKPGRPWPKRGGNHGK
jgi:excisionase family DNA binding protein